LSGTINLERKYLPGVAVDYVDRIEQPHVLAQLAEVCARITEAKRTGRVPVERRA
jgi:hypothetical protein